MMMGPTRNLAAIWETKGGPKVSEERIRKEFNVQRQFASELA
jgi:hypothetical protein